MKNYLLFFLLALTGCCADTTAQCPKDCNHCENTKPVPTKNTATMHTKPMTCKLTSPELMKRKKEVITILKKQVLEQTELSNGYSYKFNGTDETLDSLTAFIKSERMCCDFFNFNLQVANESFIWLHITGAEGVKEFIKKELEL
jgi:hypothetical protein